MSVSVILTIFVLVGWIFFLCWPIKFFLFFSSSLPYLAVDVVVVSAEYGNENYEKPAL